MTEASDERRPLLKENVASQDLQSSSAVHTGITGQNDTNTAASQEISDDSEEVISSKTFNQPEREWNNSDDSHEHSHFLKGSYESLDYEISDNILYQREEKEKNSKLSRLYWRAVQRWIVCFIIGVLTGLTAGLIDYAVENVAHIKFTSIKKLIDQCYSGNCLWKPQTVWFSVNMALVLIAALLTVFVEPVAAGSGIPQIKCYLNGVIVPHVVRFKTYVTKVIGVVCAVAGGLTVGKEGPMIHSGAVIAAGVSQGRSTSLGFDFKIFRDFRSDTEKRDFVSAGAAAGVSAAFGAPVGGVLFSLEEGASFWNQSLVWRIFFSSMVSTVTLNIVQGFIKGHPWELAYAGLIDFGTFDTVNYKMYDLLIAVCMGAIGGFLGALFNFINLKLTNFRTRYVQNKWHKVLEVLMVAAYTPCFAFLLIFMSNDCRDITENRQDNGSVLVKFFCNDGEYSSSAKLFFDTPEATVKHLFHNEPGTYQVGTLSIFATGIYLLACWTYGISVPSGLFIPSLLIGAAWGRIVGILMSWALGSWVSLPYYSLVGASAMLGGIVRMTISLTVIIMEATANVPLGLPVMLSLIVAKWVGDHFNEGIYDLHIHLQGVPILGWEPLPLSADMNARSVMNHPVTVFRSKETVERIVRVLKETRHNGFPVVEGFDPDNALIVNGCQTFGTFRGFILRNQLITILQKKLFTESHGHETVIDRLRLSDFNQAYPRYMPIQYVNITDTEAKFTINLEPFINQSQYVVLETASYSSIFRKFRSLGLRHIVVINFQNQVIGIVTRKDLARFKISTKKGKVRIIPIPIQ